MLCMHSHYLLTATEWSHLLLRDVICSQRVTMHFQRGRKFVPGDLDLRPLTLTFKLVRARDQTCLLCEFGANQFSGSPDISYTNKKHKKSQTAPKTRTLRSSLCAVINITTFRLSSTQIKCELWL